MQNSATTHDGILNRRVHLEQPRHGFRVAIDTVFLAAAIPAQAGQHILDMGCGVGGVLLALAARVPDLNLTGIDIQPDLIALAERNMRGNPLPMQYRLLVGDATAPQIQTDHAGGEGLCAGSFDHVAINPPYHDVGSDPSPHRIKDIANRSDARGASPWITAAARALAPAGRMTMIHRAECMDSLLQIVGAGPWSQISVQPLAPRAQMPATRMILAATKSHGAQAPSQPPIHMHPPFLLHQDGGGYTDEANAILRDAMPLPL